jgi:DNA processing protein
MTLPARLVLRCATGIGTAAFHRVIEVAGSAEVALDTLEVERRAEAEARARTVLERVHQRGIRLTWFEEHEYPETLRKLEHPPPVIFTLGRFELLERASVAIVGARGATSYGLRVTRTLALGATLDGVTVVSGLARGIDAEAHAAALSGPGSTIAVLGTGVDVPYPLENVELYHRIAAGGLLLSEALPGARAHAGSFPTRNRLIAALADVVLVTEAGVKSGSLITAGHAGTLGRLHAAVPGPIDTPTSLGSNLLLRDGAQTVTSVEDLLGLVALTPRGSRRTRPASRPAVSAGLPNGLSDPERAVLRVLRLGPRLPDELIGATGLAPAVLAAALATLSVHGLAHADGSGVVRIA